jgi:hypothetical protein
MTMVRFDWSALAVACVALAVAPACEAELEEDCTAGPCGGATVATATVTTGGVTTGGGGGGGEPTCEFDDTGEIPCDPFRVLATHCHKCHQEPPLNGAPFNLLSVDAFEGFYPNTDLLVWSLASSVVKSSMPFDNPPLSDKFPEDEAILQAWLATCADDGACERVSAPGTGGAAGSGGAPGSGGAGG